MKQTPIVLDTTTIGGLYDLSKGARPHLGQISAICWYSECLHEKFLRPLSYEKLIAQFGRAKRITAIKLKCSRCEAAGRDPYWTSIHVEWLAQRHVTGRHPGAHSPGVNPRIGHNGAPREPVKILKKRRRKKSSYAWTASETLLE